MPNQPTITTGPITAAVAEMTEADRRQYILTAFASLAIPAPFVAGDYTITIHSFTVVNNRLSVWVSVTENGDAVTLPADALPLEFSQPGIFAPDGTTTEVSHTQHGETTTWNEANLHEDLGGSLQRMVSATIETIMARA